MHNNEEETAAACGPTSTKWIKKEEKMPGKKSSLMDGTGPPG